MRPPPSSVPRALAGLLLAGLGLLPAFLTTAAAAADRPATEPLLGGSIAPIGGLPFLAKIEARSSGLLYTCSGTVIAPTAVLTAGHCAFDAFGQPLPASAYTVTTGTSVVAPVAAQDPAAEQLPVSVVQPYGSSTTTLHGDVAVLRLAHSTSAPPVALASPSEPDRELAGTGVTIAGWGRTSDGGGPSPELRQGAENLVGNAACLATNSRFDPRFQLCAQAPASSADAICSGDSGGPALVSTAAGWVEVGVVSYHVGEHCGNGPDYYARVSTLQPWIASVIAEVGAATAYMPAYAPTPSIQAAVVGGRVAVTFAAATAEPAALVDGYSVSLRDRTGRVVVTRALRGASTATFALPGPGSYTAAVATRWVAGPTVVATAPLTITALSVRATARARVVGSARPGATLRCVGAAWSWRGTGSVSHGWLRNGRGLAATGSTYRVRRTDAGARLACRATLRTSTGETASTTSAAVTVPGST